MKRPSERRRRARRHRCGGDAGRRALATCARAQAQHHDEPRDASEPHGEKVSRKARQFLPSLSHFFHFFGNLGRLGPQEELDMKHAPNTQTMVALALALGVSVGGVATAARNPAGTGQPGAPLTQCGTGSATVQPKGQTTSGFTHAGTKYAGSTGTASAQHAKSTHAISQYDVSCFQKTQQTQRTSPATKTHPPK